MVLEHVSQVLSRKPVIANVHSRALEDFSPAKMSLFSFPGTPLSQAYLFA